MKGDIKYTGLVANEDGEIFIKHLQERIDDCKSLGYETEIQYESAINSETGYMNWSALIIGRER